MINFELWWYLPIFILFLIIRWSIRRKLEINTDLAWEFIFLIYIVVLIQVTIFPIRLPDPMLSLPEFQIKPNWIPFATISHYLFNTSILMTSLKNLGGNAILLFPLCFLLPLRYTKLRSFKHILVIGLCFAFGIEITQLLISLSMNFYYRSIDVDDVILNTLGAILGYGAFRLFQALVSQSYKTRSEAEINSSSGQ